MTNITHELALLGISARRLQLKLQHEELDQLERELKGRPAGAKVANGRTYKPMSAKQKAHLSRMAKARWKMRKAKKKMK